MEEMATWMKKAAPEAPITDPLHPNSQPDEATADEAPKEAPPVEAVPQEDSAPAPPPKNVIAREPDPMKELNDPKKKSRRNK